VDKYAREFIFALIHQLVDVPPPAIVHKTLEVLGKITIPVAGEEKSRQMSAHPLNGFGSPAWMASSVSRINTEYYEDHSDSPMSDANVSYALKFLDPVRRRMMSRDREVFSSLVQLFSYNEHLLADLSNVLTYMCKLQPPAFIMLSFAVELDRFIRRRHHAAGSPNYIIKSDSNKVSAENREASLSRDFRFVSCFIQHMNHVFLNTEEAKELRLSLKDCVGEVNKQHGSIPEKYRRLSRLFNILLHAFSHNIAATLSLCLWSGAYKTAVIFLSRINPLDINLICLLELDRLVEMLERPLFR
jgi:Vacuolar protein 14 C-terminal Fig4p binding